VMRITTGSRFCGVKQHVVVAVSVPNCFSSAGNPPEPSALWSYAVSAGTLRVSNTPYETMMKAQNM
jgi:hypothetical protein